MKGILSSVMIVLVVAIGLVATFIWHSHETKNNVLRISTANVSLEVDAGAGGRISSLKIDGHEILYLDTANGYWGSTFWPSPQADWDWPPPAVIDSEPYSVDDSGDIIVLKSGVDDITRLSVRKTFSVSELDTAFVIRYSMTNHDTMPNKYAPWEITRVPCKGLVFAAKNSGDNDYLWFDLNLPSSEKSKVNSDGEGWQAYVNNDGYVLIKTYPNISPCETAPGEGEFELYRDTDRYVELENQGSYATIEPGGSLNWEVKWYVRKLPCHIKPEYGNRQLVDYVLQVAKCKAK
jgi:hypothetical protein